MSPESRSLPHDHVPRNRGVDYLRGGMIIAVVVTHIAVAYQTTPEAESLLSLADIGERYRNPDRTEVAERLHQLSRASVNPIFFLLSGFS